ncbi:MAG: hypothetical protein ACLRRT_08055 [Ruthenibacterium lactatiformans]
MKKSNRTVRKMRSAWTGFAAACLAAALTMSALVSCAPQESRPVVTSDDLTPPSAAQEAIAQEAGGGKNYAYYWQAENAEETLQMLREAYEQEVNDAKELIAKGEEAVKAAGYPSLAEAQQAVEARQARIEQDLADNQKRLEAELALDPVVSAQEAANLAGSLFEKLYGFDLSQDTLLLQCFESDSDMSYHPAGGGVMRAIWHVSREEAADGVLFSTNAISCTLDATTGEFIAVDYTLGSEEIAAMQATAVPACFIQRADPDAAGSYGYWDETEASYAGTVEKLKAGKGTTFRQCARRRRGSDGGPCGAGRKDRGKRRELISLWVDCDSGKTYQLYRGYYLQPYVNYDFGGYPLRAYRITNDTYLKGE